MTKDDLDIAVRGVVKAAFPVALPTIEVLVRAGLALAVEGFSTAPTEWQVKGSLKRLQEGRVLRYVPDLHGWVHGRTLRPARPFVRVAPAPAAALAAAEPPKKAPPGPVSVFDLARAMGA